jgi:putative ABC transport system permease protein
MKNRDIASYSLQNLRYRRIRSWLTIIGIIIGITSVVVLVGLAQGLKNQVNSQLESFGPRTIMIAPYNLGEGSASALGGASTAQLRASSGKLYEKDYEKIKKLSEIETITKVIIGRTVLKFKDEEITGSVYAIEPDAFTQTTTVEVEHGRLLEQGDKGVAVIGHDLAKGTYKKDIDVGALISVGGKSYRVIGILKKTGNSFAQIDNVVFVSFDEGKDLFSPQLVKDEISAIRVVVREGEDVTEVGDEINSILLSSHKVTEDKKDFTIVTPEFINKQVEGITGILTAFLGGIAAIALAIGAIGISNTMFTSVLERRKEIGVLKSIGASEKDIQNIFIVESAMIGSLGGVSGLVLGAAIIFLINILADFPAEVTIPIGLGAMVFSATVGILAGVIPAARAARLDPIEALRYE